jgi:hypothetical protein
MDGNENGLDIFFLLLFFSSSLSLSLPKTLKRGKGWGDVFM